MSVAARVRERLRELGPGVALTGGVVVAGVAAARVVPGVSPAVVAVAAGAALANLGWLPGATRPGLAFITKRVLRVAIVLLGLQIALPELLALGWQALVVIAGSTAITFLGTRALGARIGVPPRRALLIATGVSICGAAAIAAMDTATKTGTTAKGTTPSGDGREDDDVGSAVAVVTLFGSAAIVLVPMIGAALGLSPREVGLWAGASVHEVAQVAAIGAAGGAAVLAAGIIAKLSRVLLLGPMVALVSLTARRTDPGSGRTRGAGVPWFVAGFAVLAVVRSAELVPAAIVQATPQVTNVLLAAALFGLGTGVDVRRLLRGGRSLLLGGIATMIIATVSLAGVTLVA
ncbi:putative sulfate exporter family transporter [Streptosporangium soli]|nr:putative sulfate exporter family transporter [Streptosporangium sp. KLBMP 9127]